MQHVYALLRDVEHAGRDYTQWQNTLNDKEMHEAIQEAKRHHYVVGISSMLTDGNCEVTFGVGEVALTAVGQQFLAQYRA